jgi:hypothetical protein
MTPCITGYVIVSGKIGSVLFNTMITFYGFFGEVRIFWGGGERIGK